MAALCAVLPEATALSLEEVATRACYGLCLDGLVSMPIIPVLRRPRQENHEFEASLGYVLN